MTPSGDGPISCTVLANGVVAPNATAVMAKINSIGTYPNIIDASGGVEVTFQVSNLPAGVYYDAYCAQTDYVSSKMDVFTSKIIENPTISNVWSTSVTVTAIFESSGNARCVVLSASGNSGVPTASQIYAGNDASNSPVAGVVPSVAMAYAGLPFVTSTSGLSANQQYLAYCAQGTELKTSSTSFTTAAIVSSTTVIANTGVSVTLSTTFSLSGKARCIVLASPSSQPTATQIMEGTGVTPIGSYPAQAYVEGNTPYVVVYDKLVPGALYDAY
eukprot:Stramenopile-MAST_4_protein_4104